MNFAGVHAALRARVEQGFLPGVSTALLRGREVVDLFVCGHADIEAGVALREDHLFRVFSNTKLATSCAVLLLLEDGRLGLDDPVERYLPELANRQVLRPGASRIDEVEPARSSITVRHLMTHSAGLSYGFFDPGTLLFSAYQAALIEDPAHTADGQLALLAGLPLAFHPGTQWQYSIATDVLGHLIARVTGRSLGEVLQQRLFAPLGMADTGFWVPEARQDRLCTVYTAADPEDPRTPGLLRGDGLPYPGAYLRPPVRESGGGGLVSTLGDWVRLIQALVPDAAGRPTLLKPESLAQMRRNQLAPGLHVQFPNVPSNPGRVFGLASGVTLTPGRADPPEAAGEVSWGGAAGTVWWINPRLETAGLLMTQRWMGSGHPYIFEFKRLAYEALAR